MRRRWHVSDGYVGNLAAGWFGFGFIATVAMLAVNGSAHHHYVLADWIVLAVWLGPFALALATVILALFMYGLCSLWRDRPRRVTEPVLEDLRERQP